MTPEVRPELEILAFKSPAEFRRWLVKNHAVSPGIWLRFFKKASREKTIAYSEALEEALCYGWIDSQVKKYDAESYLQKFTPRRSKSIWSKVNREKVAKLIAEKRMKAPGLVQVAAAKEDGRWDAAYDSPKNSVMPSDFLEALQKNKKAKIFFASLNKTNTYAIAWQLHHAKRAETRTKRIRRFIAMLARGEKLHP